jgi:hypothetical protein
MSSNKRLFHAQINLASAGAKFLSREKIDCLPHLLSCSRLQVRAPTHQFCGCDKEGSELQTVYKRFSSLIANRIDITNHQSTNNSKLNQPSFLLWLDAVVCLYTRNGLVAV